MSGRYPEIVYTEEGMREGMQIEDANIPIDAKVALLVSRGAPPPTYVMPDVRGRGETEVLTFLARARTIKPRPNDRRRASSAPGSTPHP